MKKLFLIIISVFSFLYATATTYYFSDTGNDLNDGKSKAAAWFSLKKLSAESNNFKAGDSLLFERGSEFNGQITISTSGLYLGAYGTGLKPIVSGSIEIREWVVHEKNIWKAKCLPCVATPTNLFINGSSQPLGRYPNTGYLKVSAPHSRTSFTDDNLRFDDGYWDRAEIAVKSTRWTIENLPVKKYSQKAFTTSVASSYTLRPGVGYFIQNHLSTLDKTGEWFYDASTNEIYLFLKAGLNPMNQRIQLSILDVGLDMVNVQDVVVENIRFSRQRLSGITIKNSRNSHLVNVDITQAGRNGLEVTDSENPCIENSLITDSNNNGVQWHNNTGGVFSRNVVSRTGIHPGRGVSGDGTYIAIRITSDANKKVSSLFQHNTIDSTGYSGIDFRTGNTTIKNNVITNFCLTKDDGGGIYTWENNFGNNHIVDNVIDKGIGSGEGTINPKQVFANGIYIDDRSSQVVISGNEVSNCATSGIFLHNAKDIEVIGNTLFKNGNSLSNKEKGQLYIKVDTLGQWAGKRALHLTVSQNKLITDNETSYCIYLSADKKQDIGQLGTFTQNQYRSQDANRVVGQFYYQSGLCLAAEEFSLADWQRQYPYEKGSTFKVLSSTLTNASKELIANGKMTTDIIGWRIWPENATLIQEREKIMDGPSLKINISSTGTEALVYQEGFPLSNGKLYRLSFSVMSAQPGKIEFVPLMATSPWGALGAYTCFSSDSTYKTFTYFFRPDSSNANARVNFKSDKTFWLDNVSLHEVQ